MNTQTYRFKLKTNQNNMTKTISKQSVVLKEKKHAKLAKTQTQTNHCLKTKRNKKHGKLTKKMKTNKQCIGVKLTILKVKYNITQQINKI